jgi:methionyl-tRNA formyltransferase
MSKPPIPRVILCTSGGLFGARVLERLLSSPDIEVAGIVKSTRILHPKQGWLSGVSELLRRTGLRYTLYLGLATGGTELLGTMRGLSPVQRTARRRRLPLLATPDLNEPAGRGFVAQLAPDVLLSAFFNQRIDEAVFTIPRLAGLNIHPSLLPDFRGVDPVFHARLRGVETLGVSVHRLSAELDAGQLLAQARVPVAPYSSVLAATLSLFDRGATLFLEALPGLLAGDSGRPQPSGGGYDSWPTPEAVHRFRSSGGRLWRVDDLRLLAPAAHESTD